MPGPRTRETREPGAIGIPIIIQDPRRTPNPVNVTVRGPLLPGPIGERMAVFDYHVDRDVVFPAATPRKDGSFPEYELHDHAVPPAQHLCDRSPCDRAGRARTWTAPALGIRRQPAARDTARRHSGERLLQRGEPQPPVLFVHGRRPKATCLPHGACTRHRGSRNRPCHPRRGSPSLLRAVRAGDLSAARGHRRPVRGFRRAVARGGAAPRGRIARPAESAQRDRRRVRRGRRARLGIDPQPRRCHTIRLEGHDRAARSVAQALEHDLSRAAEASPDPHASGRGPAERAPHRKDGHSAHGCPCARFPATGRLHHRRICRGPACRGSIGAAHRRHAASGRSCTACSPVAASSPNGKGRPTLPSGSSTRPAGRDPRCATRTCSCTRIDTGSRWRRTRISAIS